MATPHFIICLSLCFFSVCGSALAQGNYQRSDPPRKKSTIEKLSDLNRKLKQNIKQSLFGVSDKEEAYPAYRNERIEYRQPGQNLPNEYDSRRQSDGRQQQYQSRARLPEQQRVSQAQFNQDLDYGQSRYQDDNRSQRPYPEPRQLNPVPVHQRPPNTYQQPRMLPNQREQYRDSDRQMLQQDTRQNNANENYLRRPVGEQYGAHSGMPVSQIPRPLMHGAQIPIQQFEPPAPQYETPAPQYETPAPQFEPTAPQYQPPNQAPPVHSDGEYRSGHYQYENVTQQQFDQQETATQRVIRLNAENLSLREIRKSITAENKRLKAQLREKNELLKEITVSIEAARTELQRAKRHNAELGDQIATLESEKAQQFRESTNKLNAIRKKLDDLLMLEMTSK